MAASKTDWAGTAVLSVALGGVAFGAYSLLKGKPGVSPGGDMTATFSFDYSGQGGSYKLQVKYRKSILGIPTYTMEFSDTVSLTKAGHYKFVVDTPIDEAADKGKYKAMAWISSLADEVLIRATDGAIKVV